MTRSGWHANAPERGGGLVLGRDTASGRRRHDPLPRRPQGRTSCVPWFVASSGHELGHLGLHDYLRRTRAGARGVRVGPFRREHRDVDRRHRHDAVRRSAARRRAPAPAPHGLEKIRQQVAGEAATIEEAGGRFVSFIGANAWFHNPHDLGSTPSTSRRWPDLRARPRADPAVANAGRPMTRSRWITADDHDVLNAKHAKIAKIPGRNEPLRASRALRSIAPLVAACRRRSTSRRSIMIAH
jgi:hypothetical protein